MPRHQDDGLPHKEQEQAPYECHNQDKGAKKQEAVPKYIVNKLLPFKAIVQPVNTDVLIHQIKCYADDLAGQNTKQVRYNDE